MSQGDERPELNRQDLARRLHSGPLQSFFAALLLVESEAAAETIESVLTEGAAQLRAIIGEIGGGRPGD